MAYITLKNVVFEYPNGFRALDNVNLEIERGENVAIVGQNGAGKTTMVKLCNRLLKPTSGDVMIGDKNTKNFSTAQISRVVGYVFQNPDDQIFHSSVESEVEYGPKMKKISDDEVKKAVDDALKITGLAKQREEHPYNLPLSIRKFVTIAAIIAMDTDVIILDEPTAGQDSDGNKRLRDIIQAMLARGKTLITISHDMEFVAENFLRLIVMADGKVQADGAARDVFWNFEALKRARITQPTVSRICRRLGIGGNIITMNEAAGAIAQAAQAAQAAEV